MWIDCSVEFPPDEKNWWLIRVDGKYPCFPALWNPANKFFAALGGRTFNPSNKAIEWLKPLN